MIDEMKVVFSLRILVYLMLSCTHGGILASDLICCHSLLDVLPVASLAAQAVEGLVMLRFKNGKSVGKTVFCGKVALLAETQKYPTFEARDIVHSIAHPLMEILPRLPNWSHHNVEALTEPPAASHCRSLLARLVLEALHVHVPAILLQFPRRAELLAMWPSATAAG